MIQATITKIKKSSVSLPKTWQGARVFLRVFGDTATITKIPKSKIIFTNAEIGALRSVGKKITKPTLDKALHEGRRRY